MLKAIIDAWNGNAGVEEANDGTKLQFEDVRALVARRDPSVVLVDAREPSEFSVVQIPGSINVPYKSHPEGFSLSPEEFARTFGTPKPDTGKDMVFFCASGMRAGKARDVAIKNGYTNTKIYPGSMNDWVAHGGDKLKL
ncbi:hypothetical protein Kpol_413p16 [Vanderwaltozyma polyspora DSM 70294]|uniref:Rhodanese domain-containing protein n=1 Tax=Vanderwaltozyma polyspora (strain ATCC 22028 / DSM 70294 / BCRC 21397 / CBS 2163 / NBRC 10782 / NRRL Y-8283 / UCD 57-17) TaxID=436907 RepID=A7TRI1_VANPO|nr:uncharacterized protein Kpol_413p16 [Vanderwaltozyma polyspora DSM 70294]EDO15141.1 hypothetical protein Kpol_413p16 [Vanderwaltozyma polyspora DSM 70294]